MHGGEYFRCSQQCCTLLNHAQYHHVDEYSLLFQELSLQLLNINLPYYHAVLNAETCSYTCRLSERHPARLHPQRAETYVCT